MRIEKTEENASRCICLYCPSYSTVCKLKNEPQNITRSTSSLEAHTHYEKLFCAYEKSNCIHIDRGCLCEKCYNYKKYGLRKCDFCLHTGGLEQRPKDVLS